MIIKWLFNNLFTLLVACSVLGGCATARGDGVVIHKELYDVGHNKSTDPIKDNTMRGMRLGVGVGLGIGSMLGVFTSGLSSPGHRKNIPSLVAIEVLGNSIIFAGLGSILGGGAGLFEYLLTPTKKEVWRYEVQSKNDKVFKINQKTSDIPVHAPVKIMEQNGKLFIRKKK